MNLDQVEERLLDLEAVSHAPVSFLTCGGCHCAVAEEYWDAHVEWHIRVDKSR